jgi:hypothetical protein
MTPSIQLFSFLEEDNWRLKIYLSFIKNIVNF